MATPSLIDLASMLGIGGGGAAAATSPFTQGGSGGFLPQWLQGIADPLKQFHNKDQVNTTPETEAFLNSHKVDYTSPLNSSGALKAPYQVTAQGVGTPNITARTAGDASQWNAKTAGDASQWDAKTAGDASQWNAAQAGSAAQAGTSAAGLSQLDTKALGPNETALNSLRNRATAQGDSPWLQMQKAQNEETRKAGLDVAGSAGAGNAAAARDQLAMHGGLQSGAAERIAQQQGRDVNAARQDVNRAANVNALNLGIADDQTKTALLGQAAGLDLSNAGFKAGLAQTNMGAANQNAQFNSAATNQAALANAAAQNQTNQFNVGAQNQALASNQAASNQMKEFNAGVQNQAQAANQAAVNQMKEFNAGAQNSAQAANQAAVNQMKEFNTSAVNGVETQNMANWLNAHEFTANANNAASAMNANNALGGVQGQNNFNIQQQGQQLAGFGAAKQSDAIANSGKK